MTPRKKKEEEVIEGLDVIEDKFPDNMGIDNNAMKDKLETINEAVNLTLEDLDGIGPIRLKKLRSNGIYTVDDLLSHGEESLVRMLDISWDDAKKMTMTANDSLNTEDVFSSMVVSGKDYFDYRKTKIYYLKTGHEEFDEITGGYESGVITEFFGLFGSGKTQFMMVACIMAQLPKDPCCLHCGKVEHKEDDDCKGLMWKGGGISEYGKPTRVVYIDTENSYRPDRVFQIVCNRNLILTKEQTKTQIKQQADKEPLNDVEYDKAMEYVNNIDVSRPKTSALQMIMVANLSSVIEGLLCKHCHRREINKEGLPTHQNHPKAKADMNLLDHDFMKDKPAKLIIMDSITGKFRKEFEGRGTLSDRQTKLSTHVKLLEGAIESKNCICLVTNQAQEALGVMGDNVRPIGGNVLGHTFTARVYLKKTQSLSKNKITAILVDSPNRAKNEVVMELGALGIQKLSI
jgi:DNA repair protein RadA